MQECAFSGICVATVAGVGIIFRFRRTVGEGVMMEFSFQRHLHTVELIEADTFGDQKFSFQGGLIQEDLHQQRSLLMHHEDTL